MSEIILDQIENQISKFEYNINHNKIQKIKLDDLKEIISELPPINYLEEKKMRDFGYRLWNLGITLKNKEEKNEENRTFLNCENPDEDEDEDDIEDDD
ncbi:hypothetical protein M0811_09684 [Anaeramoeba ignava]|uniref:Uncharacterized protein n=1 Tax=Anaeramoeba ignava TaxID=1746090 RepID=A0A9Q0LGJ5_ANAIG|nr:hypothetical protein M0811_09684 [Anaeramoeba ignava]